MKFILASIFIHGLILGTLFLSFSQPFFDSSEQPQTPLTLDFYVQTKTQSDLQQPMNKKAKEQLYRNQKKKLTKKIIANSDSLSPKLPKSKPVPKPILKKVKDISKRVTTIPKLSNLQETEIHSSENHSTEEFEEVTTRETSDHRSGANSQTELLPDNEFLKSHYLRDLKIFLEQNKKYPRQAILLKQSGIVEIEVHIDSEGKFSNIRIAKTSPFPALNQAAINLLKNLGQFRPPPISLQNHSKFKIPISFDLGRI